METEFRLCQTPGHFGTSSSREIGEIFLTRYMTTTLLAYMSFRDVLRTNTDWNPALSCNLAAGLAVLTAMRYSADLVIPFSSITAVGSERASVFATLAIMRLSRRFAREIVR
eukprot:1411169-Pleurochrysis_carterae.AAC.1